MADLVETGTWCRTRPGMKGVRMNARPGKIKRENIATKAALVRDIVRREVYFVAVGRLVVQEFGLADWFREDFYKNIWHVSSRNLKFEIVTNQAARNINILAP